MAKTRKKKFGQQYQWAGTQSIYFLALIIGFVRLNLLIISVFSYKNELKILKKFFEFYEFEINKKLELSDKT